MILRRLGAFLLDILILDTLVMFPFSILFKKYLPEDTSYAAIADYVKQNEAIASILIIIWTFYFLVMILYFSVFEYLLNATPGKKMFDLVVVGEEGELMYWQTIVRSLQLFFIIPVWLIDIIYLAFKKKRLFEAISKTKVMHKPSMLPSSHSYNYHK